MNRPCFSEHPFSPRKCERCRAALRGSAGRIADKPTPQINRSSSLFAPTTEKRNGLETRTLPCFYLGPITDIVNSNCPARWVRSCAVHGSTTIQNCKTCEDYEGL